MKRIAATLVTSALVGALAMPAFAGSPTLSLVQKPQDARTAVMQPSNGLAQTPSAPEAQGWRGEHRRPDWDRSDKPVVQYGSDKPPAGYYYYPKRGYHRPVYVPSQWIWDGHVWVLTPGYWAY